MLELEPINYDVSVQCERHVFFSLCSNRKYIQSNCHFFLLLFFPSIFKLFIDFNISQFHIDDSSNGGVSGSNKKILRSFNHFFFIRTATRFQESYNSTILIYSLEFAFPMNISVLGFGVFFSFYDILWSDTKKARFRTEITSRKRSRSRWWKIGIESLNRENKLSPSDA